MSMDVWGRNPNSVYGNYFTRHGDEWAALWSYCASLSPEAASLGSCAYSNDGDGLDAKDAKKLAKILRKQLASGATKAAVQAIKDCRKAIKEFHRVIGALESFIDDPTGHGTAQNNLRCRLPKYVSEPDLREFATFLEHCGGFSIR